MTGAYIGVINNAVLVQWGQVYTTDGSATGAVMSDTGAEERAPASGIPAP